MTVNIDAMLADARESMGANIVDHVLRDIHQALVATVEVIKNLDADRFNGTEAGVPVVDQAVSSILLANLPTIWGFVESYYNSEADFDADIERSLSILNMDQVAHGPIGLREARIWHLMQMIFWLGMVAMPLVNNAIEMNDEAILAKHNQADSRPMTDDHERR